MNELRRQRTHTKPSPWAFELERTKSKPERLVTWRTYPLRTTSNRHSRTWHTECAWASPCRDSSSP